MATISTCKNKVKKGLDKGICQAIYHNLENIYDSEITDDLEIKESTKFVVETTIDIQIPGTNVSFSEQAYNSDLEIAKNILPGDEVYLKIIDNKFAIWLKKGEQFDKNKHLFERNIN